MKRLAWGVLGAILLNLVAVAPALAGSEVPEPDPGGIVVRPPGGTAFTGADVTVWMVLALVLLAAGVGLIVASRRRRTAGMK